MACLRRRPIFGIFLGGGSALAAIGVIFRSEDAWFALLGGVPYLLASLLWIFNYFVISRLCVGPFGLRRVEWMGLVANEIPFGGIKEIDCRIEYFPRAVEVIKIKVANRTFSFNTSVYGDEGIRGILRQVLTCYPEAPLSARAVDYLLDRYRLYGDR